MMGTINASRQCKYNLMTQLIRLLIFLLLAVTLIFHPKVVIVSENIPSGIFTKTPISLPHGLRVEEYHLEGKPAVSHGEPFFEPRHGLKIEIMKKHEKERNKVLRSNRKVYIGKEALEVEEVRDESKVSAKLSRNGEVVFTMALGDNSPVEGVRGLWLYKNQWILEVAHCKNRKVEEGRATHVYTDCNGEIIQDGKSLSKRNGYQETFGFQLMKGKQFFFFKKKGQIGISYDGQEILLRYSEVPHYYCCTPYILNPNASQNMVSFFARRDSNWYYVEIGVFH